MKLWFKGYWIECMPGGPIGCSLTAEDVEFIKNHPEMPEGQDLVISLVHPLDAPVNVLPAGVTPTQSDAPEVVLEDVAGRLPKKRARKNPSQGLPQV